MKNFKKLEEIIEQVEMLDQLVDRLLENQKKFETKEGDELISSLLYEISMLERKIKDSSKQAVLQ